MTDFYIKDNFLISKNSIITIFKIEPIDIALLPQEGLQIFNEDLKNTLRSLGTENVQIIMRTRNAKVKDIDPHLQSLLTTDVAHLNEKVKNNRSNLLKGYLKSLVQLLESSSIPVKEYFLVFKKESNIKNQKKVIADVKQLDVFVTRVTGNLRKTGIKTFQITNYNTINFNQQQTTNDLTKVIQSFLRI